MPTVLITTLHCAILLCLPVAGSQWAVQSSPPWPLASKLSANEVVDARDFGAVGDGISDDGPALQAAIDAAQYGRKPLVVPAGLYAISSTLIVRASDVVGEHQLHNCTGPSSAACPAALHMTRAQAAGGNSRHSTRPRRWTR
jgi:hypothetical protein